MKLQFANKARGAFERKITKKITNGIEGPRRNITLFTHQQHFEPLYATSILS